MHNIFRHTKVARAGELVIASDWKQNHKECVGPLDSRQASTELLTRLMWVVATAGKGNGSASWPASVRFLPYRSTG